MVRAVKNIVKPRRHIDFARNPLIPKDIEVGHCT